MVEIIKEPAKKVLSREEFLSGVQAKTEEFHVEGLGSVKIKAITLAEREEIRSGSMASFGKTDEAKFASLTLLKGLVDPKLTLADVAELQKASFGVVTKIGNRIWALSGISAEETAKNA